MNKCGYLRMCEGAETRFIEVLWEIYCRLNKLSSEHIQTNHTNRRIHEQTCSANGKTKGLCTHNRANLLKWNGQHLQMGSIASIRIHACSRRARIDPVNLFQRIFPIYFSSEQDQVVDRLDSNYNGCQLGRMVIDDVCEMPWRTFGAHNISVHLRSHSICLRLTWERSDFHGLRHLKVIPMQNARWRYNVESLVEYDWLTSNTIPVRRDHNEHVKNMS